MKPVVLFAGPGSQAPGMGADFYEQYEEFRRIFDLLPKEQKKAALEGPMEALTDTRNTQPCMVAFGAGVYDILKKILDSAGICPTFTAGLSLGEYTALYSAGAFDAKEAIDLVTFRAQAMYEASFGIECAMAAVLQLDRETLAHCCQTASKAGLVQIANYNCPGQIVIAGEKEGVALASALAAEKGAKRVMPLAVSGPFHTDFMKPAGDKLKDKFQKTVFREMQFPVVFNTLGRTKTSEEDISDLLVRQVQSSVYFEDSLNFMEAAGADTFIEIGPGKALTGFVKKTCKSVQTFSINRIEDLKEIEAIL